MALNLGSLRNLSTAELQSRGAAACKAAGEEVVAHIRLVKDDETRDVLIGRRAAAYAKKGLHAVALVRLEDRPGSGTIKASRDGAEASSYFMKAPKIIEPESCGDLILAGVSRDLCAWVNRTFPSARMLDIALDLSLDGDWTEEQRAQWRAIVSAANGINAAAERLRKPPKPKHRSYGNGYVYNPW